MSKIELLLGKIVTFAGKTGAWIVANKTKSIIIGAVAAVAIGGTITGIVLANRDNDTYICQHRVAENNEAAALGKF